MESLLLELDSAERLIQLTMGKKGFSINHCTPAGVIWAFSEVLDRISASRLILHSDLIGTQFRAGEPLRKVCDLSCMIGLVLAYVEPLAVVVGGGVSEELRTDGHGRLSSRF
jgi:hypothetical protein